MKSWSHRQRSYHAVRKQNTSLLHHNVTLQSLHIQKFTHTWPTNVRLCSFECDVVIRIISSEWRALLNVTYCRVSESLHTYLVIHMYIWKTNYVCKDYICTYALCIDWVTKYKGQIEHFWRFQIISSKIYFYGDVSRRIKTNLDIFLFVNIKLWR